MLLGDEELAAKDDTAMVGSWCVVGGWAESLWYFQHSLPLTHTRLRE